MRKLLARRCLLAVVLVLSASCLFSSVSRVFAFGETVIYSQISPSGYVVATDNTNETSWSYDIYNFLTYNTTNNPDCKVFFSNSTTDPKSGITFSMVADGSTRVWYQQGSTLVELTYFAGIGYGNGNYFEATCNDNGYFSLQVYDNASDTWTTIIDSIVFTTPINAIEIDGSTGSSGNTGVATAGYLNIVDAGGISAAGTSSMTSTVNDWLPIIITFAFFGLCLGFLKKMGRW